MTSERTDGAPEIGRRHATQAAGAASAAAVETGATWEAATDAVLDAVAGFGDADLAIVFIDSRFSDHYGDVLARLRGALRPARLVGCSGQSVIGPVREAEDAAGVSVLLLRLPGAALTPVTMSPNTPAGELDALEQADATALLIFADPFSVHVEHLLHSIEQRRPRLTLLGGMASSHDRARRTAVFLDGDVYDGGAVTLAVGGTIDLRTVVAQGAEPIGQAWTITDCDRNVVRTLGNRSPIAVLRETIDALAPATRERASRNLLVGLAIDEYRHTYGRGDYLIRNLLGFDQESGAIAVSANVRVGQTLQFQFRDALAAHEDLHHQLGRLPATLAPGEHVLGALLCTCNGRGRGLFGTPDHDARAIDEALGALPTAGLFCNGEIGPVSGKSFLHGFTASVGLFTTRTFPAE